MRRSDYRYSGDEPPKAQPVRKGPRTVTLHIEHADLSHMMQVWGPKLHSAFGMALLSGAQSHSTADIYAVSDRELMIRNQPTEAYPNPASATVTLEKDGSVVYRNVENH